MVEGKSLNLLKQLYRSRTDRFDNSPKSHSTFITSRLRRFCHLELGSNDNVISSSDICTYLYNI